MRGRIRTRTLSFLTSTLAAIADASRGVANLDRESLALLAKASEKAAQWQRDTRTLTRNDGTGIVRVLVAKMAQERHDETPITALQEAYLLQAQATEQFLLCDYTRATSLANQAYRLVRPL